MSSDFQKKAYFSGKKILKWYEYQMEDSEADKEDSDMIENVEETISSDENVTPASDESNDLDDEVSRIMANFRNAHQDSVDSLFANLDQ